MKNNNDKMILESLVEKYGKNGVVKTINEMTYEYDYNKPYMCMFCQLEEYGEIDITPEPVLTEVDDLDDLI